MPLVRRLTNRIMSAQISCVCGQPIPDTPCGFRMFHRDLAAALCETQSSQYDFETEMLVIAARRGGPIAAVPVSTGTSRCAAISGPHTRQHAAGAAGRTAGGLTRAKHARRDQPVGDPAAYVFQQLR